jgi:hypothetical protein
MYFSNNIKTQIGDGASVNYTAFRGKSVRYALEKKY